MDFQTSCQPAVKETFFARGTRELPEVTYPGFDPTPSIEAIREVRRLIVPVSAVDLWFERQAESIEGAARMLAGARQALPAKTQGVVGSKAVMALSGSCRPCARSRARGRCPSSPWGRRRRCPA